MSNNKRHIPLSNTNDDNPWHVITLTVPLLKFIFPGQFLLFGLLIQVNVSYVKQVLGLSVPDDCKSRMLIRTSNPLNMFIIKYNIMKINRVNRRKDEEYVSLIVDIQLVL